MAALSVKHFKLSSGEGYKLLVDANTGIPLYYPSLYVTSQKRGNGHALATVQSTITALKTMYAWLDYFNIDIEGRFINKNLLLQNEIISLRDFCKKAVKPTQQKNVLKMALKGAGRHVGGASAFSVSSETQYQRLTEIAKYFEFIADYLCPDKDQAHAKDIEVMCKRIKAHRPKKKGRAGQKNYEKGLDLGLVDQIFEIMRPGHEKNPFVDKSVQNRNYIIILLFRFLGVRRGELLNIRIEDINFSSNYLKIVRRPDSPHDERTYAPNVKTLERHLSINDSLAKYLHDYITVFRRKYKAARKHPYLFVTHKAGRTEGKPLSNSGFGKMMATLQSYAEELSPVHAHAFRHTWNYEISVAFDNSEEPISEAMQDKIRSESMGWKPTSGTAATYNARHIREKSKEAILDHQKKLTKRLGINDK